MLDNFRHSVLKLQDIIETKPECKQLTQLLFEIQEDIGSEKSKDHLNEQFAYIANGYRCQFYGFLFVDQNIDELQLSIPLELEHLNQDEQILFTKCHQTITHFIELCLSELKNSSELIAQLVDPYSSLRDIKMDESMTSIITDEEMNNAVTAFQSGKVYQALKKSNAEGLFEKFKQSELYEIIDFTEKKIHLSVHEEIDKDINHLIRNIHYKKFEEFADFVLPVICLIASLRESLKMSCQYLYESLCGDDLTVLNDNNIFRYSMSSNVVCNVHHVDIQNYEMKISNDGIGSVVLIDCHPSKNEHVHVFGYVDAQTTKFNEEIGPSTKYTIVEVNEEMIDSGNLIDLILKDGPVSFEYQ